MADSPEMLAWCPECGAVLPELKALREEVQVKEENLRDLERALRAERRKVSSLRAQQRRQQSAHPFYAQAVEVFDYWRAKLAPKAREFTGERFQAVVERLEATWTVEDLKQAVDGGVTRQRRGGSPIDLHSICRNEKNLMLFMGYADSAGRLAQARAQAQPALEAALDGYVTALADLHVERLCELRGWTAPAIRGLGLGFDADCKRIVFPIYDKDETLVGFSRWLPNPASRGSRSKNIAEGPRDLFPPPERIEDESVWLVEGEPDAVAMASIGQSAIGVPGVSTWKQGWAERFAKFDRVRVLFDCDQAGRDAAECRQRDLHDAVPNVQVIDLDPSRSDGYDVGDLILSKGQDASAELGRLSSGPQRAVRWLRPKVVIGDASALDPRPPVERVLEALTERGCAPKRGGHDGQYESRCPAHADKRPSLSIGVGDDGRCLLNCHTGCDPGLILDALDLEWRDVFAEEAG